MVKQRQLRLAGLINLLQTHLSLSLTRVPKRVTCYAALHDTGRVPTRATVLDAPHLCPCYTGIVPSSLPLFPLTICPFPSVRNPNTVLITVTRSEQPIVSLLEQTVAPLFSGHGASSLLHYKRSRQALSGGQSGGIDKDSQ